MQAQEMMALKPAGESLLKTYLSMNVENLWIAGHHIDWMTGIADRQNVTEGVSSHCSAFVAAACEIKNIYILRPPEHSQILLANAQARWLPSAAAKSRGWHQIVNNSIIAIYFSAQQYANKGFVVVAVFKSPVENLPGHIALVRPSKISAQSLTDEGPSIIMAGTINHNLISLKMGFKNHIKQWPNADIQFFYNDNSK